MVTAITFAVMNADDSATSFASMTQPFGFKEILDAVLGDMPEIFDKADIIVSLVSSIDVP